MNDAVKSPLEMFYHWEAATPDKVFLRQAAKLQWSEYTWAQVGDQVRRVASFTNEFRFSITRDVLKVSLQSTAAAYTAINAPRPDGMPRTDRDGGDVRFAFSGGPGLHLLLEGMFQLDAYVMFGLRPQNPENVNDWFSVAFQANLGKAF